MTDPEVSEMGVGSGSQDVSQQTPLSELLAMRSIMRGKNQRDENMNIQPAP